MSLIEELKGAKIVRSLGDELVLAWHGGHGIHGYDEHGHEVVFRNVGDWSKNEASETDIEEGFDDIEDEWSKGTLEYDAACWQYEVQPR